MILRYNLTWFLQQFSDFVKETVFVLQLVIRIFKFFSSIPGRMSKLDHLSSNHVTSSSLGSRLNYNYTSHSTPPNRRSPSPYQSSIIQITREDGRVERRLETCSYQETEMVSDLPLRTFTY